MKISKNIKIKIKIIIIIKISIKIQNRYNFIGLGNNTKMYDYNLARIAHGQQESTHHEHITWSISIYSL